MLFQQWLYYDEIYYLLTPNISFYFNSIYSIYYWKRIENPERFRWVKWYNKYSAL